MTSNCECSAYVRLNEYSRPLHPRLDSGPSEALRPHGAALRRRSARRSRLHRAAQALAPDKPGCSGRGAPRVRIMAPVRQLVPGDVPGLSVDEFAEPQIRPFPSLRGAAPMSGDCRGQRTALAWARRTATIPGALPGEGRRADLCLLLQSHARHAERPRRPHCQGREPRRRRVEGRLPPKRAGNQKRRKNILVYRIGLKRGLERTGGVMSGQEHSQPIDTAPVPSFGTLDSISSYSHFQRPNGGVATMLMAASPGGTNGPLTSLVNGGAARPARQAAGSEDTARPRRTPRHDRPMQAPFSNMGRYTK